MQFMRLETYTVENYRSRKSSRYHQRVTSRVGSRLQTILETEHYELISLLHIWASLRETDSSAIF